MIKLIFIINYLQVTEDSLMTTTLKEWQLSDVEDTLSYRQYNTLFHSFNTSMKKHAIVVLIKKHSAGI